MAYVIVKPTDTSDPDYATDLATYNAQLGGIRKLASPDLRTVLTEDHLPESIIADDVYLLAAEREVLRDAGIDTADVSSLSTARYAQILYLVQIREAIELIPQVAQLLQQTTFSNTRRYAETDWQQRVDALNSQYLAEIQVINPTASVGDFVAEVVTTNSGQNLE